MSNVALAADAIGAATAISSDWPVRLEPTEPIQIQGDAARLRQASTTFSAKVRAHTPPGTNTGVSVSRHDHSAVIRVADDGPGIDAADAERLFERFYRADPSRSHDHGGSGLGLAIVAAIVHAHDGDVTAAPDPGGGAVFTITLPSSGARHDWVPAVPQDERPPMSSRRR